jgi:signal transduction histidine kinase
VPKNFRPHIATVLLIVNLAVVILPLGGLVFFRIYENQLVRQTESELISQGAVLAAAYRQEILDHRKDLENYGITVPPLPTEKIDGFDYVPIFAKLDLTDGQPLPDRSDGRTPKQAPDDVALAAGRKMTAIISQARRSTLAGLKILDFHGVAVAGRFEVGQSFAHVQEVAEALTGKYASVIRKRETREPLPSWSGISRSTGIRIFVAYPVIADGHLLGVAYLSRSPNSLLQQLYRQRGKVLLAGLAVIGITLLLALLTSATISRPIKRLVKRARKVADGDVEAMAPMARPGTQEMEMLSKSFSDMANTLHDRSEYIRQFASHVSHEFKTPLTSIQGAAELLDEHFDTMSGHERKRFTSNILQDSNRLRALVTRLLDLAKADSTTPDGGQTDVIAALDEISSRYSGVVVDPVAANAAISVENFSTIFSNLVENAFHHNANSVAISATLKGRMIRFTVTDNGEGISSANLDKVFTPFFTTRRGDGGTGLGLGIVRSIVEAHGGSVIAVCHHGGAMFDVFLPAVHR